MPFLMIIARRFQKIRVQYLDIEGKEKEKELEGDNSYWF
jgi:peptide deformylase